MNDAKLNKLANMAVEDMKRVSSRLHEIQDACRHKEHNVELISGTLQTACTTCYKVMGMPTPQQIKAAGYTI